MILRKKKPEEEQTLWARTERSGCGVNEVNERMEQEGEDNASSLKWKQKVEEEREAEQKEIREYGEELKKVLEQGGTDRKVFSQRGRLEKSLKGYDEGRKIWQEISTGDPVKINRIAEMCVGKQGMQICYGNWNMRDAVGVCQRCGVRGLCKESIGKKLSKE